MVLGRNIAWLREINARDQELVGWKAVVLGDLFNEAFPVPMAFAVTTQCMMDCFKENAVLDWMKEASHRVDWDSEESVRSFSEQLREKIERISFSEMLKKDLKQAYLKLGERSLSSLSTMEECSVAVRGSPTESDWAMESELNISGFDSVLESIKRCWASLYSVPALMGGKRSFSQWKAAVVVQKMAKPDMSGTLYTADPWNERKESMALEVVYGLQAPLLEEFPESGDYYQVEKKSLKVLEKKSQRQSVFYPTMQSRQVVATRLQEKQKLTDNQIILLCKMGKQLELHYKMALEMGWAIENARPMVLQVKPWKRKPTEAEKELAEDEVMKTDLAEVTRMEKRAPHAFDAGLQLLVEQYSKDQNVEHHQAVEQLVKLGLEKHQQNVNAAKAIPLEDKTEEAPAPEPAEPERTESDEAETIEPNDPAQELKE